MDDTHLDPGTVSPRAWAGALAYLKAAGAARKIRALAGSSDAALARLGACADRDHRPEVYVLGADTVVIKGRELFGKAVDAADARRIIRAMNRGPHEVVTGVCLLGLSSGSRHMFADAALVRVGEISDDEIERYVASGRWAGKAGAYNLEERVAAGWPITWSGDPGTVTGLPMERLRPLLKAVVGV